ncbi:cell wall-binding repeat-containing protein [Euzebya sp.]|uniref:cell wall-binding repeat-containing protein n=1 Tax=Euzebya sp. TaxID=1971409 RepID=UPI0035110B7D
MVTVPPHRLLATLVALVLVIAWAPTGAAQDPAVRRIAGDDRAGTAAAVAADGWDHASTVVLVDGWDHVVALVGAHLAARLDAPVLVSAAQVPPATQQAVDRLAPERVVVVGDVALPSSEAAVTHVRAGSPAALAAEALGLEPGPAGAPVVVAAEAPFADALAGAALAPARLLLTPGDVLAPEAAEAIRTLDPEEVVVLGGPAAVSDDVVAAIEAEGPAVDRLAGPTRYDTAVVAAGSSGGGTVVVASGQDHADALAFVPWAARRGATLVVTTHDELPSAVEGHLRSGGYARAVVAGGTVAVGTFVDEQVAAALAGVPPPGFDGGVRGLTAEERAAMTGVSWRDGCPVGLDALRVVEVDHWTFDGDVRRDGQLVVHADVAEDVRGVMAALFDARFPLASVRPVREHGGDDDASMAANNTSAFNCRFVGGTSRWSEHAYGTAVDLNPVQNPYVRGGSVDPPAGAGYVDRTDVRPGMIVRPGPVVDAFAAIGWGWGADFSSADDYQHFSASGR